MNVPAGMMVPSEKEKYECPYRTKLKSSKRFKIAQIELVFSRLS